MVDACNKLNKINYWNQLLTSRFNIENIPTTKNTQPLSPNMITLEIDGGKKQKVRPGDILGALTGKDGISGSEVGKINVFDYCAYVAVNKKAAKEGLKKLEKGKLKGRNFRVWRVR